MQRGAPFLEGEIYHIYNRGAHKADIFLGKRDYLQFKLLLFLANSKNDIHLSRILRRYRNKIQGQSLYESLYEIFYEEKPDQSLVGVFSYALIPNHFHLIIRQKSEHGITRFMKKVGTGYSMYFNTLHEHSGTVFQGPFKSRHVDSDAYLRWLFAYVALNPLDVGFPGWKERGIAKPREAYEFLKSYAHASFPDMFKDAHRPERAVLALSALEELHDDVPDFSNVDSLFELERAEPEI